MRYLKGTLGCGLVYGKFKGIRARLQRRIDADYTGDLDRKRSLTGNLFIVNGRLINWKATIQHAVALSTTEAEYTAITEVAK